METLNKSGLLVLHDYNQFANRRVFGVVRQVDESALLQESSPSHHSVLGLMTHMLVTEFFFLARSEGKPVNPKNTPDTNLRLEEVIISFEQVGAERLKYLNWATEERLLEIVDIPIGSQPFKLPRWQLLAQSLLHSLHHRGELSIVLTSLGHPLPTLDPILRFVELEGQTWPWD